MARLKDEASQRMADIRAQADRKIHEQNEALARIQAQAAGREAELTSQLEEYRATVADKERAIFELQSSLDNALDWHRRREESHRQQEERLIAENEELQSQRASFKEMADEFFIKCKLLSEQNEKLSDDCHGLHEEKAVALERVRAECKQDWMNATEELTKRYEQSIQLVTAEAKNDKASYSLLHTQLQVQVNDLKMALETARANPGMDETRIRILIEKHRNLLNRKVEEAFSRAGEEWAAQAAELHILRADAENRRKEGRGFFKMDEASIQTLRADLTEDYQSLVKSHTAAIEQLLEDFNDDQMVFRLEAEALEHEQLATLPTSPPPATEQTEDPPREEITTTAQEELATTTGQDEAAQTEPTLVEDTVSLSEIAPPTDTTVAPATDAPVEMATPTQAQPDHPATTPDPENILDILIEDCDED